MTEEILSLNNVGLTLPWRIKLSLNGIREKKRILSGINFKLRRGEIAALVGRNGCGKSTLFRVISGIYSPTEGRMEISEESTVSVMALSMGFMHPLTGRENVILQGLIAGLNKTEAKEAADGVLNEMKGTQLSHDGRYDMPYSTYSAGMKASIAASSALLKKSDIILVDEVFGVGDAVFRENLANKLKEKAKQGTAIIIVSHDKEVLQSLCARAIVLSNGSQIPGDFTVDEALKYVSVT